MPLLPPRRTGLLGALADNVYLREVLDRRLVELVHVQNGREVERCERVRHLDPPATTIIGPDHVIERVLRYMSASAVRNLGVDARPSATARSAARAPRPYSVAK